MNVEDNAYDEDDIEEEFKDNNNNDTEQIAKDLVADWQINDWVVVLYYEQWYPGIVQNIRILFKITLSFETCKMREKKYRLGILYLGN